MQPLFFCKPRKLGLLAFGPLMIGALYATYSVAQAQESTKLSGQWYKSSEMAGTGSVSNARGSFVYKFTDGTYEGKTPDQNYGDAIGGHTSMNNDGSLYADSNSSAASAKLSDATIKITYRWGPASYYGNGPFPEGTQVEDPDPKFSFLVRGYAGAGAGLQGEASASADGKKGVSDEYKNSSVQFKRLFSFDTKGQTEFSAVIPFSAEATLPAGNHMYGSARVNFDAYADIDNRSRSVSIGSPTIEPSYYNSGALPPSDTPEGSETTGGPVPGAKELNVPNADGSKVADSVAQWRLDTWQVAGVPFTANISGDWHNPTFAWSISGDTTPTVGFDTPEQQPYKDIDLRLHFGDSTQGFPKSSNLKVDVTDGEDGTVGNNTFDVKWHLPYEKTFDLPDGPLHKDVYWISKNYIGQGAIIETIPAKRFDYGAAIDDVLVLADAAGVPGSSETQAIFKALTNISEWGETQEEYHVTGTEVQNTHEQFGNNVRLHPDNIEGMTVAKRDELYPQTDDELRFEHDRYVCYIGRVRNYRKKSLLADKYNQHGYESSNHVFSHDVTVGQDEFQTFYRRTSETPTPPPTGDREIPPSYNLS